MKIKQTALVAAFLALAVCAFAQLSPDLQTVAVVRLSKSQNISVKELKDYVTWMGITKSGAEAPGALSATERREVLDKIGEQLLLCQAAEQENMMVSNQELNERFNEMINPIKAFLSEKNGKAPTDAEVDAELRTQTGMTRVGFREQIRRSMASDKYIQTKKQNLFQAVRDPGEAEILELYNQQKGKSLSEGGFDRPQVIRLKMIVIPYRSAAEKTAAQERGAALSRQIGNDPVKFDEASADAAKPNSGYISGEGPYLYKFEQTAASAGDRDFLNLIFGLKQGEVSRSIERPDAFYIIKVLESLRPKTLTLDDIYNLGDPRPMTVRQYIGGFLRERNHMETYQRAYQEILADLKKRGSVQVMDNVYNSIVW
ncbi:MAG: peptidylprolyl isomerase [Treponema sp.]|jgi:parvulin-like peptidyl-prolyl isomerase|nr:peptidylprolyl isomerase [Treponema sp.]